MVDDVVRRVHAIFDQEHASQLQLIGRLRQFQLKQKFLKQLQLKERP